VSSDQLSYVLVALIVTGIAILLLLVGALIARRGRDGRRDAAPFAAAAATAAPAPPPAAIPVAAPTSVAPPVVAPLPHADLEPLPEPPLTPADADHPLEESAVTSADLAAAARRVEDPREQEIIEGFLSIAPRRREAVFAAPAGPTVTAAVSAPSEPGSPADPGATPPDPYVDDATGLDSRAAWERVLAEENARYVRYRRPVGIVMAELDGFTRFEDGFGTEASRRVVAAVAGAMRRSARRTDHIAHVGGGRFLVLLPETDEIQAINYVERIRGECDRWLDAGAVALRLSLGWASPSAVGELDTAVRTAEERMYAERRRASRVAVTNPDASR
jgi:diguanylate cyclase (GGDEF)-like protein